MACPSLDVCGFLNNNAVKDGNSIVAKGFMKKYCNDNYNKCFIYSLGKKYGRDKLPENLMPNGLPLAGTDKKNWPEEIKKDLTNLR